jgi:uncharacterized membrane protein
MLLLLKVPFFHTLVWLTIIVLAVMGAWAAFNGNSFRLPLIASLFENIFYQNGKENR